jgi:LuxR family maltose regulon positive regulatory protein
LAERGRSAEAIAHAMAAGDHETAFSLIIQHRGDLYEQGHRAAVGHWLLDLPDSFIVSDPERAVDHCEALLFVTRPEWLRWRNRAESIVGDDRPDLRARLLSMNALARAGQGRLDEFTALRSQAEALGDGAPRLGPLTEVLDAWHVRLLTLHHHDELAVPLVRQWHDRPRQLIRDLPAQSLLAATLHHAGDPEGDELARQVIADWRAAGEPDFLGMADALCVRSASAVAGGDIDEAELLAAAAMAVTLDPPPHLLRVRAEVAVAAVEVALHRTGDARSRLERLASTMEQQGAAPELLALMVVDQPSVPQPSPPPSSSSVVEPLTDREQTILGYLAGHLTFPEIACELFISRHTVKTHVGRIYRKLGVTGRSAAIQAARARHLL